MFAVSASSAVEKQRISAFHNVLLVNAVAGLILTEWSAPTPRPSAVPAMPAIPQHRQKPRSLKANQRQTYPADRKYGRLDSWGRSQGDNGFDQWHHGTSYRNKFCRMIF